MISEHCNKYQYLDSHVLQDGMLNKAYHFVILNHLYSFLLVLLETNTLEEIGTYLVLS